MASKQVEREVTAFATELEPAQLTLLRRGQAGDQRPRVRPADGAADGARGRSTPSWSRPTARPSGRRPAAGRVRDRRARRADALDRQHVLLRRGPRVGRPRPQGPESGRAGHATSSSSRSTAWPSRSATRTAGSSWARPAATASAATTSRPTCKTVREIPLRPARPTRPTLLEVRGEVYMTNSELARLNELRTADGETPFANPRNSTAGSLKLLDPELCGQRRLRFVSHGLGECTRARRDLVPDDHRADEGMGHPRQPAHRGATTRSTR